MGDSKSKRAVKDVEQAFTNAVRQAGVSASIRRGLGERIEARAIGQQILTGTVSNYIQTQARQALCSKGYATTLTCSDSADGVDFVFEVDRRRVVVGVSISF